MKESSAVYTVVNRGKARYFYMYSIYMTLCAFAMLVVNYSRVNSEIINLVIGRILAQNYGAGDLCYHHADPRRTVLRRV